MIAHRRLITSWSQRYPISSDMSEGAITAGEKDDLHAACGLRQNFDHRVETGIVGVDQRIVQDQRHGLPLLQQHIGECNPCDDGKFLLSAARQARAAFVARKSTRLNSST